MKRVVKKQSKKNRQKKKNHIVLAVIICLYVVTSILLKNYNTSLNIKKHDIEVSNKQLVNKNATLKLKIDELRSFDRINAIAKKNGLTNREGAIKNVR